MPGLAPYNRILTANQRVTINARGTTVFLRVATGAVLVTLRSQKPGEDGESYTLEMTAAEEWRHASEFTQVEVENTLGSSNTIEFYIGYGAFRKPVPDIVNVSTNVPASDTIACPVRTTLTGVGNANADLVAAADDSRISVTIQADKANDQIIRVGDSAVDTDQGIQLEAGEAITINSKAAVYVCEEVAGTNYVNVFTESVS